LPTIALRIEEAGANSVRARVVLMPQTETGSIVRLDLGRVPVGRRFIAPWPAGTVLAPGRYRVRLHVRGLRGTVLVRKAATPGRATLTVQAPAPPPVPLPDPTGHVFPVQGPHTYGDGFGAPRNGYSHQGQDIPAAEGTPVVAPSAGAVSFTDYQAKAAGYYVVEKGSDGLDYFFAHCQAGTTVVTAGQVVAAGQQLCSVGATGDATGPHLHFEVWEGGWRVDAGSHPIDPLPLLRSWDVSAPPAAARR
jgi:murein DD-endopeptidase MepM/ murein hydrolase activator NlpD